MARKPIFMATHPRACSTAFERVFMTRRDTMSCIHEPFGDAFYFGPERLSARYEDDEPGRARSGFAESTYATVLDGIEREIAEGGKRVFIKDIAYYLMPPDGKPASIAPSLLRIKRGVGTVRPGDEGTEKAPEPGNPTVVPEAVLERFHFTFLIRHPRHSIPSFYRCTVPPLDEMTGFRHFMPSEAGYDELRRLFDYLRSAGQVGPCIAGRPEDHGGPEGPGGRVEICVVDADDLLDHPAETVQGYCRSVGLDYDPRMLNWDSEEDHKHASAAFEKWHGFHEDAIGSSSLEPRLHSKEVKSRAAEDAEWTEKYGDEAAKTIRATVDANVGHYDYLKQFALRL